MAEWIARLTLRLQGWTGWSREQPLPETTVVEARRRQVLGLADFGMGGAEAEDAARIFGCQVRVISLLADRAVFEYQRLVVENPDGTINLSAPNVGTVLLKVGQHVDLATPTMDGGLLLRVGLEGIEEGAKGS